MTKETGIIMSGNHPKLILDGIKTMTRRTYGLEEINKAPDKWDFMRINNDGRALFWRTSETASNKFCDSDNIRLIKCPYGQIGDRLWVKEAWRVESFMDGEPILVSYKDGSTMEDRSGEFDPLNYEEWYERICIQSTEDAGKAFEKGLVDQNEEGYYNWDIGKSPCRWRSPRFMPRWASRLTLEITEVRAERLQETTEEDANAEGIIGVPTAFGLLYKPAFSRLWDSLNAKRGYSWESNPWVWVISFP